jgi:hypothetical protein
MTQSVQYHYQEAEPEPEVTIVPKQQSEADGYNMHRIPSGIVRSTTTGQQVEFFDKVYVPSSRHWGSNCIYLQESSSNSSPSASPTTSPRMSPTVSPQMCPKAVCFKPQVKQEAPPGLGQKQPSLLGGLDMMLPAAMAA